MSQTSINQTLVTEIEQLLPPEITTALTDFQRQLLDLFPGEIEQIILYGSYATGQATSDSDVDVLVVVPWRDPTHSQDYYLGGPGDPRWQQIVDLAMDVLIAHGPYISALVVGETLFNSNWSVAEAAKREGKILWQKPLT
ncbi:MAG: nucleotidyltransferase domain-containing protein [Anaerolineales bacterium]|nr:nucleotidyltransferase domain-containing protein [Anaerolineales bacterium]